jgi:hypothetical protein
MQDLSIEHAFALAFCQQSNHMAFVCRLAPKHDSFQPSRQQSPSFCVWPWTPQRPMLAALARQIHSRINPLSMCRSDDLTHTVYDMSIRYYSTLALKVEKKNQDLHGIKRPGNLT